MIDHLLILRLHLLVMEIEILEIIKMAILTLEILTEVQTTTAPINNMILGIQMDHMRTSLIREILIV